MAENDATLLKVACQNAYEQYPDSCSHAVWSVIRARVDNGAEHRQANKMIDWLSASWDAVTLEKGFEAACKGRVVVGGLKGEPNGHVIVIFPGDKLESGGYSYYDKKRKKDLTLRSHGKFPPCLSTSIGSWPGAKSNGDKTVWDPWANDAVFKDKVGFWTPKSAA
jgi:hypothetical protein